MKRSFFSNISLLIFLNIIVKAFWVLGIDRTVQNRVGAEVYGFYFSLFSFSVLFNILLDFGITNYNNRKVAANPELLPGLLGNFFIIRMGFAIIYLVVSLIMALSLGYTEGQRSLLLLLLGNQFLASFILYLRSNITALQLFRVDSLISVTDRFIMIIVCGLLLWGGITGEVFRIEWFVYSQTVAYLITFLISLIIVLSKSGLVRISFSTLQIPKILRESAPFAMLSLFMAVYWRVDTVMLERMAEKGDEVAGIYAQAFRLLDAAAMIPYLFAVFLLPMFSRAMANRESAGPLSRFAGLLLVIPATVVSLFSFFYSDAIMKLLYHSHIEVSASVFRILMAGYVPVAMVYVYSTVLTAGGRMRILNRIAGAGMIVNILLNYILIARFGAIGSAFASVFTQVVMSLFFYYYASRVTGDSDYGWFIIKIFVNLILVGTVGAIASRMGAGALSGLALIAAAGIVMPFVTGLLKVSDLGPLTGRNIK